MRRDNVKKCCGTCWWMQLDPFDDGPVCVNDRSEYYTDWVEKDHRCGEWEGKEE